MNAGGYRDARAGLAQRIADAEHAIAHCDEQITAALMRLLPQDIAGDITSLRREPAAKDDSFEELTRVADSREALLDALSRAIAFAPQIQAHLQEAQPPPDAPPQEDMWGPIGTEEAIVPTLESAREIAAELDAAAVVTCAGPRITVRLHIDGVALLWCIELHTLAKVSTAATGDFKFLFARHLLEMRIAEDLPRLTIHVRTWKDAIFSALEVGRSLKTGDRDFDDALAIRGDEDFALPLLSEDVRRAFWECANAGKFSLISDRGLVTVKWGEGLIDPRIRKESAIGLAKAVATLHDSATNFSLVRSRE